VILDLYYVPDTCRIYGVSPGKYKYVLLPPQVALSVVFRLPVTVILLKPSSFPLAKILRLQAIYSSDTRLVESREKEGLTKNDATGTGKCSHHFLMSLDMKIGSQKWSNF
jgi:hypothetical protein